MIIFLNILVHMLTGTCIAKIVTILYSQKTQIQRTVNTLKYKKICLLSEHVFLAHLFSKKKKMLTLWVFILLLSLCFYIVHNLKIVLWLVTCDTLDPHSDITGNALCPIQCGTPSIMAWFLLWGLVTVKWKLLHICQVRKGEIWL